MSYEDQVLEFLAQPDNLPIAIQVADYIQKLKEELHQRFWPSFNAVAKTRLTGSEHVSKWSFSPFPIKRLRTEYQDCAIFPLKDDGSNQSGLAVFFGQSSRDNSYRFYHGIKWIKKPKDFDHPLLTDLKSQLVAHNLIHAWDNRPGLNYLHYRAQGEDFMLKMYHEPEIIVGELVDNFWQLFLDFLPIIDAVNKEVPEKEA